MLIISDSREQWPESITIKLNMMISVITKKNSLIPQRTPENCL